MILVEIRLLLGWKEACLILGIDDSPTLVLKSQVLNSYLFTTQLWFDLLRTIFIVSSIINSEVLIIIVIIILRWGRIFTRLECDNWKHFFLLLRIFFCIIRVMLTTTTKLILKENFINFSEGLILVLDVYRLQIIFISNFLSIRI